MKKYPFILSLLILFALGLSAPACSQKSGCPANESLRAPIGKKGEIRSSRSGKSSLFPKKMTKKMKK